MIGDRPLFHIHVPKTAGLTLRMIFAELYGLHRVYKLGVYAPGKTNTLEEFMAGDWPGTLPEDQRPFVYLGHFPFGAQRRVHPAPLVTTCLRHPVERVLSLYEYLCRTEGRKADLLEFVETDPESNNGTVRRLRGLQWLDGVYWDFVADAPAERGEDDLRADDLALARTHLAQDVDFILIQEHMTRSLVALRHVLQSPPLISMRNHFRNNSPRAIQRADYPAAVIDVIVERNQLDLELYQEAVVLFEDRFRKAAISTDEIRAMDDISAALMIRGHQDLPFSMISQRLNQSLGKYLEAGELRRDEMMLRLLTERLPDEAAITQLHASIRQHCLAVGQSLAT